VGADPAPARAATRCALAWVRFSCQPGRQGPGEGYRARTAVRRVVALLGLTGSHVD